MTSHVRLPNGQVFAVTPVARGIDFRLHEPDRHEDHFPVRWLVVLESDPAKPSVEHGEGEVKPADDDGNAAAAAAAAGSSGPKPGSCSWTTPTLRNDRLFLSSTSSPSVTDSTNTPRPTHPVATMLWITLYWYFQQPAPCPVLDDTDASKKTPQAGKPRGDWRVAIHRDGVFRDPERLSDLERLGLVATLDSSVDQGNGVMFVFRRMFWQLPERPFLTVAAAPACPSLALPPLQYVLTDSVRHPLRPRPPRMGELFYARYVPSARQYLSLRVASSSDAPVPYLGPRGPSPDWQDPSRRLLAGMSDAALLRRWFASPRVQAFWGAWRDGFLAAGLASRHSFPVIGLWDGVPFGYFEIYWVKEDVLGRHVGGAAAQDWDRGVHVFVGEEWARGRVQQWLSGLVHWCFAADPRTQSVCIEPRVDNVRFIQHLQQGGFQKEGEVTFPHKQSWFGRLRRESWEGPAF